MSKTVPVANVVYEAQPDKKPGKYKDGVSFFGFTILNPLNVNNELSIDKTIASCVYLYCSMCKTDMDPGQIYDVRVLSPTTKMRSFRSCVHCARMLKEKREKIEREHRLLHRS